MQTTKCMVLFLGLVLFIFSDVPSLVSQCNPEPPASPPPPLASELCGMITCAVGTPSTVTCVSATIDGTPCPQGTHFKWEYPSGMCVDSNYYAKFWTDNSVSHIIQLRLRSDCCSGGIEKTFTINYPASKYVHTAPLAYDPCVTPPTNTPTPTKTNTPTPTPTPTSNSDPWSSMMALDSTFSDQDMVIFDHLRSDILSNYPAGQRLIYYYSQNIEEIYYIMALDIELRYRTFSFVKLYMPIFKQTLNIEKYPNLYFPSKSVNEINQLIDGVSFYASPSFKEDLEQIRQILLQLKGKSILAVLNSGEAPKLMDEHPGLIQKFIELIAE